MKKNMMRGIAVLALVLVVFLVIAFVCPFPKTAVFVVSLLFGITAAAVSGIGTYLAFKDGADAKSKFYGFPIAKLAVVYGIAQLVLSLIFMAVGAVCPVWVAVVIDIVLLAAACIGMIAADATRDEIIRQDEVQKADTSNMLAMRSKANTLPGLTEQPELKKQLTRLAEQFRYSDPVGSEALASADSTLFALLDDLQQALLEGDADSAAVLSKKTALQLEERNRLCKLNKTR